MKKIKLPKEDKARLLKRFNVGNVVSTRRNRVIPYKCLCDKYPGCYLCPFGDCSNFVVALSGKHIGAVWFKRTRLNWIRKDDDAALKVISAIRRWLNSLP